MRRLAVVGALLLLLAVPLLASVDGASLQVATPPLSASPSPVPEIALVLPTEEQVPPGLVMIEDGARSLEDVTSGFSDPAAAAERFTAWGWQRNLIRAFHTPEGAASDPTAIDGIYVSVHEFGTPPSAAEALDYSLAVHAETATLDEVDAPPLGDYARALYGPLPYGNEITLYVQQGNVLIRISASSPEGDPRAEAIALVRTMLEQVSPDLGTPPVAVAAHHLPSRFSSHRDAGPAYS